MHSNVSNEMHSNVLSEMPRKMRNIIIATEIQPEVVLSDSDEHISHKSSEYCWTSSDR